MEKVIITRLAGAIACGVILFGTGCASIQKYLPVILAAAPTCESIAAATKLACGDKEECNGKAAIALLACTEARGVAERGLAAAEGIE